MKLDRNIEGNNGGGKYALIKLRGLQLSLDHCQDCGAPESWHLTTSMPPNMVQRAHVFVEPTTITVPRAFVDFGQMPDDEGRDFFVIRIKDKFAAAAFKAYRQAVNNEAALCADLVQKKELYEWAKEIEGLEARALAVVTKLPD